MNNGAFSNAFGYFSKENRQNESENLLCSLKLPISVHQNNTNTPQPPSPILPNDKEIVSMSFECCWTGSSTYRQSLEIRISIPDDPSCTLFLSRCIGPEDFDTIARNQNILVDFRAFPHKLIDLVNQCCNCVGESVPRFRASLFLEGNSAGVFSITEVNSFRQIVHISLKLTRPSEDELRSHINALFKSLLEENLLLKSRATQNKSQIQQQQNFHSEMPQTRVFSNNWGFKQSSSSSELLRLENTLLDKDNIIAELQTKISELESKNKDLLQSSESFTADVSKANNIIKALQGEVKTLKTSGRHYQNQIASLEKILDEAKSCWDSSKNELDKARKLLQSSEEHISQKNAEIASLETKITDLKRDLDAKQHAIDWLQKELNDGKLKNYGIKNPDLKYQHFPFDDALLKKPDYSKFRWKADA